MLAANMSNRHSAFALFQNRQDLWFASLDLFIVFSYLSSWDGVSAGDSEGCEVFEDSFVFECVEDDFSGKTDTD